jgi:hypothetical protein
MHNAMRADDKDASAPAPAAVTRLTEKAFLGPEFLTWLYFTLLENEFHLTMGTEVSTLKDSDDKSVQFAIGKRVALASLEAAAAKVGLSGPGLDDNGEVLHAVRRGALIDTLSLEMSIGSRVYAFTLRGSDGSVASLKLPDLFSEPEEDDLVVDPLEPQKKKRRPKLPLEDILALRMQCADEVEEVIDALFARFVTRRLARAWQTEDVTSIRKRVTTGLKARVPLT